MDPNFYNSDQPTQALVGVLKTRGVHDRHVRVLMLEHMRRGRIDSMRHAVAQALIADGLLRSEVPAPASRQLAGADLLERVQEALHMIALRYHNMGGVVTARGYWGISDLSSYMFTLWHLGAPAPIGKMEPLPTYELQAERVARASVAAQALRDLLVEKDTLDPAHPGYLIKYRDLESFCMAAVQAVFGAYNAPDEWIHEKLHKKDT